MNDGNRENNPSGQSNQENSGIETALEQLDEMISPALEAAGARRDAHYRRMKITQIVSAILSPIVTTAVGVPLTIRFKNAVHAQLNSIIPPGQNPDVYLDPNNLNVNDPIQSQAQNLSNWENRTVLIGGGVTAIVGVAALFAGLYGSPKVAHAALKFWKKHGLSDKLQQVVQLLQNTEQRVQDPNSHPPASINPGDQTMDIEMQRQETPNQPNPEEQQVNPASDASIAASPERPAYLLPNLEQDFNKLTGKIKLIRHCQEDNSWVAMHLSRKEYVRILKADVVKNGGRNKQTLTNLVFQPDMEFEIKPDRITVTNNPQRTGSPRGQLPGPSRQ